MSRKPRKLSAIILAGALAATLLFPQAHAAEEKKTSPTPPKSEDTPKSEGSPQEKAPEKKKVTLPELVIPVKLAPVTPEAEKIFQEGLSYTNGNGKFAAIDLKVATDYFKDAAELNHPLAIYYLASHYHDGRGVAKDEVYAKELFERAAWLGQPDSQMIVGMNYILAAMREEPDSPQMNEALRQAARWMKNPAEKGIADAEAFYGDMLIKGAGVTENKELGIAFLRKAADKNNSNAQALLGAYYWQGTGLPKNDIEALKWLLLAFNGKNESSIGLIQLVAKPMRVEDKKIASDKAKTWLAAYEKANPGKQAESAAQNEPFDFWRSK